MFTGLVQAVGRVSGVELQPTGARLRIDTGAWGHHPDTGDSISVGGCCLTVASVGASVGGLVLAFDVVHETLRMTTLGAFKPGDGVNLEHAARADSLLGGHVVQGHVDGVATVESVTKTPEWRIRLRPPSALMEFMIPKGSVGVDGVSLTLAAVDVAAGASRRASAGPTRRCCAPWPIGRSGSWSPTAAPSAYATTGASRRW